MSQGLKLAAGFDVALGSLVDITTITPTSDEPFADPKELPLYDDGILKIRGDGLVTTQGFATVVWMFTRATYAQYRWLRTQYCSNGLSGPVTILTRLGGSTSTTRMNAIMVLPKPSEVKSEFRYQQLNVRFTRLKVPA
jgi:hypothetical protein